MNLNDIAIAHHDFTVSRGWWRGPVTTRVPRLVQWLHEEVDEAGVAWEKTGRRETSSIDPDGLRKPEGLPSELADIMLIAMDLAVGLGINLEDAIAEKRGYNAIRRYKRDAEGVPYKDHVMRPATTMDSLGVPFGGY